MESSAISLFFSMMRRSAPDAAPEPRKYLINLIDSPGHIDFSSEVSTASRLCDGAIVLVDAVEGVCSQTVTVLRQTWVEQLKPILVINKIDRLVTELQMSSAEAYSHMGKILEQVNAVIGSFYQGERMEEDLQWRERMEERINSAATKDNKDRTQRQAPDDESVVGSTDGLEFEELDDEGLYFAPEKNNVIFCSAVDGWAFTIRQFAAIYEKKLGIKRSVLEKVLWGDFYLDPKTKRVLGQKHLKGRALKPMFVQLVLDSIWAAYEATTGGGKGKGYVSPTIHGVFQFFSFFRFSFYLHESTHPFQGPRPAGEDHQIPRRDHPPVRSTIPRPPQRHDDAVLHVAAAVDRRPGVRHRVPPEPPSRTGVPSAGVDRRLACVERCRPQRERRHGPVQDRPRRARRGLRQQDGRHPGE